MNDTLGDFGLCECSDPDVAQNGTCNLCDGFAGTSGGFGVDRPSNRRPVAVVALALALAWIAFVIWLRVQP
jgi:hypothetical protein